MIKKEILPFQVHYIVFYSATMLRLVAALASDLTLVLKGYSTLYDYGT
jgi:hypothetical protein